MQSHIMRHLCAAAATAGIALGAAQAALGASYVVEPSTFTLVPPVRNATMTLTNLSAEPIRVHVTGLAWSENDKGIERLSPSPAIVVFPQLFTIPAMGRQVVRAAIVGAPRDSEQTFRIAIEDLPPIGEVVHAVGPHISIRTRFTMPIYVEPAIRAQSSHIEGAGVRDGVLSFAVLNTGNIHVKGSMLSVNAQDASGKTVFSGKVADWHVLAGDRRVYAFDVGSATCVRKLTVTAGSSAVPAFQAVPVAACK